MSNALKFFFAALGAGVVPKYYKHGTNSSGSVMGATTYASLANGPFDLTTGVTANFTGVFNDRSVVIDLGASYQNSNSTATQNGNNYFFVQYSTDGSTWQTAQEYGNVGTASSFTQAIAGVAHRYIAFGSGTGGGTDRLTSITLNSVS